MSEYVSPYDLIDEIFQFPTPQPHYADSYITLKILPTPQVRAAHCKQFWESLRAVTAPLLFELISDNTIYFQLSFAPQDEELITHQLAIYFPQFSIQKLINSAAVSEPLQLSPSSDTNDLADWQDPFGRPAPDILTKTYPVSSFDIGLDIDPVEELLKNPFSTPTLTRYNSLSAAALPAKQLYTLIAHPPKVQGCLHLDTDTAIDAYNQCLTLFAAAPGDFCSMQFVFFPVSHSAIQTLISRLEAVRPHFIEQQTERITSDEYWKIEGSEIPHKKFSSLERSETFNTVRYYGRYYEMNPIGDKLINEYQTALAKKQPAWLLALRLVSSTPTLLEKIQVRFLKHFESPSQHWQCSAVEQTSIRYPTIPVWGVVSIDELTALAHFPNNVTCELLETASMQAKLPPESYAERGVIIGSATARGLTKTVTIPPEVRDRHLYVVGKSGVGKSTLVFNAARQDIEQGYGVCVIDPHGDLVEDLLHHIPYWRVQDTIYFDASDRQHPIPLNIMSAANDEEVGILADDLLILFKRLSETWGVQMENILRYTFHTLLRVKGTTFLDIQNMVQDEYFRDQILAKITFPPLVKFWQHDFPQYRKDSIHPILNRMSKFMLSPILYGLLGTAKSHLNFFNVLQSKKILLVNLSQGKIGEDTCKLLGSLLVSQLQLNVMRRASIPKDQRHPYMLYVDEFQNFTSSAFEKILSEARKYKLCLNLAHQYTSQLDDRTRHAILSNVGTMVLFELGASDANALRGQIGQYEPTDIMNLSSKDHEALCKPATQAKDTFKFTTLPVPATMQSFAQDIIEQTRKNYCIDLSAPTVEQYAGAAPPPAPEALLSNSPIATLPTGLDATHAAVIPARCTLPAPALPKEFATTRDKILHYITQAEYLSTPQIVALCYSQQAESSRAASATRDLKKLVEDKKIKCDQFGKSKIYFVGRTPHATTHNLAVRDLFIKILNSNFEIAEANFSAQLGGINPDLLVNFLASDGGIIKTVWEYDAGTENVSELVKKIDRYKRLGEGGGALGGWLGVTFVFNSRQRLMQVSKTIADEAVTFAVLSEFDSLNDPVFSNARCVGSNGQPFFISERSE